jgi:pimeloyl-ACP methyl ester carboxylesterase
MCRLPRYSMALSTRRKGRYDTGAMNARAQSVVHLEDGRRLAYAAYGTEEGIPVIALHGLPGSRLQRYPDDAITTAANVRLIVPDRPGYGFSDPLPGRRVVDWAADVAALADTLGIRRFRVLGLSGGGPYALACAASLRDRVVRVALVSALGPLDTPGSTVGMMLPNRLVLRLVRRAPAVVRPGLRATAALLRRFPSLYRRWLMIHVSEADRTVLSDPAVAAMLRNDLAQAVRQGTAGVWSDLNALTSPWGFQMDQVDTPVDVWQGDADRIVPQQMGHVLAQRLPQARWRPVAGGGHFLVIPRWREILDALCE